MPWRSWHRQAPWRKGRRKQYGGEYDVRGACSHWEFKFYGNACCTVCGGAYLSRPLLALVFLALEVAN
eukprot:123578-Pyramimonas_sp.AAC.1